MWNLTNIYLPLFLPWQFRESLKKWSLWLLTIDLQNKHIWKNGKKLLWVCFNYSYVLIKPCIFTNYHYFLLGGFKNCLKNETCAFEWSTYEINKNETMKKMLWAYLLLWWRAYWKYCIIFTYHPTCIDSF